MSAIRSFVFTLFAATLLAACGSSGTYYEKAPKDVRQALRLQELPYHMFGDAIQGKRVTSPDDETVVIALLGPSSVEMMRFVATVTPDGTGSRVAVDVVAPEGSKKEKAEEAMKKHGFAMGMMHALAKEHVAAAIEGRPFNMMFASGPAGKMMANSPMGAQISQANETAMAIGKAQADAARMQEDRETGGEYSDDWGAAE